MGNIEAPGIQKRLSEISRAVDKIYYKIKHPKLDLEVLALLPKDRVTALTSKQINGVLEPFTKSGTSSHVFDTSAIDGIHVYRHRRLSVPVFAVLQDDEDEVIYVNRIEILLCVCNALNWTPTALLKAFEDQAHPLERIASASE